jgi:pyruvate/2-oxoacid:ferredoxin oxidoreductase alpha subunit
VAEQLLIPIMVCFDGFRLSHTMMPVSIPAQEQVDAFLPAYKMPYTLDPEKPVNINPVVMTDPIPDPEGTLCPGYMGFRRRLQGDLESALLVITEAAKAFQQSFGRSYEDSLYRYRNEDADFLFVTMGSLASEASETVDILRDQGVRAGVIGLRIFRPFPAKILSAAIARAKGIAVVEKAISYGYEGALATELKAALFSSHNGHRPVIFNYIVGLGGKDVKPADLVESAQETLKAVEDGSMRQEHPRWLGYEI